MTTNDANVDTGASLVDTVETMRRSVVQSSGVSVHRT